MSTTSSAQHFVMTTTSPLRTLTTLALAALLTSAAQASVVQATGSGSAVSRVDLQADFEPNTSLASPYSEGGLRFSHNGLGNNGGCGYAGVDCVNPGDAYSLAFSGNYFATVGSNAYVSITSEGLDFNAIELAVDSGFLNIYVMWQTWLNGQLTGSGKASLGNAGVGAVLSLADASGFDELRLYAFDSASDSSGYSAPAIDSVRAQVIPAPATLALSLAGLAALGLRPRRR